MATVADITRPGEGEILHLTRNSRFQHTWRFWTDSDKDTRVTGLGGYAWEVELRDDEGTQVLQVTDSDAQVTVSDANAEVSLDLKASDLGSDLDFRVGTLALRAIPSSGVDTDDAIEVLSHPAILSAGDTS